MDSNYCQIVREVLNDERVIDEKTCEAMAVLAERLERVKRMDKVFSGISFSPAVKRLAKRKIAISV